MIVIVEGIDRVGKTTLCEKLQERGFVLLKDGGLEMFSEDKREVQANASIAKIDSTFRFIEQMDKQGTNVVVDRLHLTEIVYAKCEKGRVVYDEDVLALEQEFFNNVGSRALLVLVEPTNAEEAFERSGTNQKKHIELFKSYYRTSPLMKLRTNFNELDDVVNKIFNWGNSDTEYDFYLASPFFRPDQVEREERVKEKLRELGYRVFSPKEWSFLKSDAGLDAQSGTFKGNCDAIKDSTAVFAITDTKDMGTIWEAGYAFGIGKPIIYFAETLGNNQFNLMLAQSGNMVLLSDKEINRENIDPILNDPCSHVPYGGAIE